MDIHRQAWSVVSGAAIALIIAQPVYADTTPVVDVQLQQNNTPREAAQAIFEVEAVVCPSRRLLPSNIVLVQD